MLAEYTREELVAGMDRIVEQILLTARIERPPVDAFMVAETLGIAVAMDDRQHGRARYVRLAERRSERLRPTILLRPEPRPERQHWAVAHEIGEHVACQVFVQWGVDPRETAVNAREEVANHVARRVLLPTSWFVADGLAMCWELTALKARYRTASHELISLRMLECRPPAIISVFDHGRMSWRKSNLPGHVPPPSRAEWACWRGVHAGGERAEIREGPKLVRGWPIHEEGWKREILRTEVDEFSLEFSE